MEWLMNEYFNIYLHNLIHFSILCLEFIYNSFHSLVGSCEENRQWSTRELLFDQGFDFVGAIPVQENDGCFAASLRMCPGQGSRCGEL